MAFIVNNNASFPDLRRLVPTGDTTLGPEPIFTIFKRFMHCYSTAALQEENRKTIQIYESYLSNKYGVNPTTLSFRHVNIDIASRKERGKAMYCSEVKKLEKTSNQLLALEKIIENIPFYQEFQRIRKKSDQKINEIKIQLVSTEKNEAESAEMHFTPASSPKEKKEKKIPRMTFPEMSEKKGRPAQFSSLGLSTDKREEKDEKQPPSNSQKTTAIPCLILIQKKNGCERFNSEKIIKSLVDLCTFDKTLINIDATMVAERIQSEIIKESNEFNRENIIVISTRKIKSMLVEDLFSKGFEIKPPDLLDKIKDKRLVEILNATKRLTELSDLVCKAILDEMEQLKTETSQADEPVSLSLKTSLEPPRLILDPTLEIVKQ